MNTPHTISPLNPSRGALRLALCLALMCMPAVAQKKVRDAASACNPACLTAAMNDYLEKVISHRTTEIKIAPDALVFFNTHAGTLDQNPLLRVKEVKSRQVFCDPETGNVVARTGVEMEDGKIAYASSRLKIVRGTITQVETSFDNSPRVVPSYVTFLDPLMTTVVPANERMSRAELKAIVERYFQALTDHKPVAADYDDRCDRFHSGQRVTNNARNTVEGGGPATCYTSILGDRPWGPATDIRIPLVDTEHGIVVGYTLLLYKNDNKPMYVSEVFKILQGKIRNIDNIGLKSEDNKPMNIPE